MGSDNPQILMMQNMFVKKLDQPASENAAPKNTPSNIIDARAWESFAHVVHYLSDDEHSNNSSVSVDSGYESDDEDKGGHESTHCAKSPPRKHV